jgi:hypothetical protein
MLFLLGLSLGCVFSIIAARNNPTISPNSHASLIISNNDCYRFCQKTIGSLSERLQAWRFTVLLTLFHDRPVLEKHEL